MDLNLTCSLSQLQLDGPTGPPISRLPNELVQSILVRVDMQQLVHLRVVCKKWHSVITSIGQNKKCLCLTSRGPFGPNQTNNIKKRSFGQIDLANTFTKLKLKPNSARHLAQTQLGKLFSRIDSLVLDLPLSDILTVLRQSPLHQLTTLSITNTFVFDYYFTSSHDNQQLLPLINLCVSLKRLDLVFGRINCQMASILAPTLARLCQFSYSGYEMPSHFVRHFGSNCSWVSFDILNNAIFDYTQWHSLNGRWLTNVTHLELKNIPEIDHLVDYLSKLAAALQVLRLKVATPYAPMTAQLIRHLSKLDHLTELEFTNITIDLSRLEQNEQLLPLVSIRKFTLLSCEFKGNEKDMTNRQFTSVLCIILPNVEHLNVQSNCDFEHIEQHLNRFAKLRAYSFQ